MKETELKWRLKMAKLKLTKSEVEHIAKLANLKLTKAEVKKFASQLSEILDYIDILKELDTKNVEPTSQVTGLENVVREDKPAPSLSQDEVLSGASDKHNNFFKTKAVFE